MEDWNPHFNRKRKRNRSSAGRPPFWDWPTRFALAFAVIALSTGVGVVIRTVKERHHQEILRQETFAKNEQQIREQEQQEIERHAMAEARLAQQTDPDPQSDTQYVFGSEIQANELLSTEQLRSECDRIRREYRPERPIQVVEFSRHGSTLVLRCLAQEPKPSEKKKQ